MQKMNGRTDRKPDGHRVLTLEYDLVQSTKSYEKLQLNISKQIVEMCGKLCISSILSPKMGIAPTKKSMRIDGTSTWSVVQ